MQTGNLIKDTRKWFFSCVCVCKVADKGPADMSSPDTCQLNFGLWLAGWFSRFSTSNFPLLRRQVQWGVVAQWGQWRGAADDGHWWVVGSGRFLVAMSAFSQH